MKPIAILSDGTEILFEAETPTTKWTLWKSAETGNLNLALVQNGDLVTVSTKNLRHFVEKILPEYEGDSKAPNTILLPSIRSAMDAMTPSERTEFLADVKHEWLIRLPKPDDGPATH